MTRIKLRDTNLKKISKALTRKNMLKIKGWEKRTN